MWSPVPRSRTNSERADPLFEGKTLPHGVSLMPVLTGTEASVRDSVGVHLFGNRGYRRGQWKISNTQPPLSTGQWELFDLEADPGEVNDLAEARPCGSSTRSRATGGANCASPSSAC